LTPAPSERKPLFVRQRFSFLPAFVKPSTGRSHKKSRLIISPLSANERRAKVWAASSFDSARAVVLAFVFFGFHRIVAHRFCLMGKTETASFFFTGNLCSAHYHRQRDRRRS
jgi:hypothetical protein